MEREWAEEFLGRSLAVVVVVAISWVRSMGDRGRRKGRI
jgi:hypothetical protein